MSIVSIEQSTSTPALDALLSTIERKCPESESLDEVDVRAAQEQGRDLVEHFIEFVEGSDNGKGFSAYFMRENTHHVFQEEGFLDEIRANYPDMTTVPCEDKPNFKDHIFEGLGVFLRQETKYYGESAEHSAVWYVAHRLETPIQVGKIAASQIMQ
jgi:hypothetical protein